jgi:hypothetical protein
MGDGDKIPEQPRGDALRNIVATATKEEWNQRIEYVDSLTPSPDDRARIVWNILAKHEELSNWDIICFCIQYIALQSSTYTWLQEYARRLNSLVYNAHYIYTNDLGLIEYDER